MPQAFCQSLWELLLLAFAVHGLKASPEQAGHRVTWLRMAVHAQLQVGELILDEQSMTVTLSK